jgi:hypothetical protein
MAITLVGSNTNSAAAANLTIDLSGIAIQEGDVVYVATSGNGNDLDVTEDSGTYTELATDLFADDSANLNFAVFRKVQTATPDTSVTINNGAANTIAGLAYVLRGVDNTTPEDVAPVPLSSTAGTGTPDPPAIDTATAGAWVLPFAGSTEADDVTSAPTDYTDLVDVQGTNVNVMVSRREIASPGTENPGTYGGISGTTADPVCAITVAVRPAAEETGRTGTMAATEAGADDATAAGDVLVAGALAATETGADDATVSGAVVVAGTMAATETGSDTFTGSGSAEGGAVVVQTLTYGAGRLSPERVRAKYDEIEEIERRIQAKEEAEREKVRKQQEAKRQLAELEEKKRQTKTIAERRRKLEQRIAAYQSEITDLRTTILVLLDEIERARVEFELQQTIADRRRRMLLLIAAAA